MTKPLLKGVLKTWKEDRGFGFITPAHGGRDIFIHISALGAIERHPMPGDVIHYHMVRDKNGKFRAVNAQIEGLGTIGDDLKSAQKSWAIALVLIVISLVAAFFAFRHQSYY